MKWFQINKIEIYDTQQEIFNFYALVKEKKLNEEKITQVVSAQIKKYLTTEQNIQVMLNDYKHQKSEIVSDTSKFPLVSFALNINMQFDENYEVLIRKNTDINNKLSHLKNEPAGRKKQTLKVSECSQHHTEASHQSPCWSEQAVLA